MRTIKRYLPIIIIGLAFIALAIWDPEKADASLTVSRDYLKEMILIIPPVFLLMGLLEVWIPKDKIRSWLGVGSGVKGALISVLLGTLPTGPLYIAFPMAASLLGKGAKVSNMILFLGAWAALKIPQLVVEMKFLGLEFTALRFVLTLLVLVIIGQIMERAFTGRHEVLWEQPVEPVGQKAEQMGKKL